MGEANPNRIFFRKWIGCVAALWMMDASGGYTFANYSSALKETLGINQAQLNWLSVARNIGGAVGVLVGVLSNYIPSTSMLVTGSVIGIIGYGTQWLVVSGAISPLPFCMMFIVCLMAGNQISWINVSVFTVCMRNFPQNRGPFTGLLKGNMGLSAAIYSMLCDYLFSGSASTLLLFLTLFPAGSMILSAFLLRSLTPAASKFEKEEETQNISFLNVLSISLAVFLTIADLISSSSAVVRQIFIPILVLLLLSPASVLLKPLFFKRRKEDLPNVGAAEGSCQIHPDYLSPTCPHEKDESSFTRVSKGDRVRDCEASESLKEHLLNDSANEAKSSLTNLKAESDRLGNRCCSCGGLPELGEDFSGPQLLRSWNFYMFYFACLCATGSGMAFSNNTGQIGESLGFSSVTVFTSFFSLGNFCGRILSGVVSEYFLRKAAVPRPVWMALGKIPTVLVFFWLATGASTSMYVGSIVVGFCQGVHMTVAIPVVCEFYGVKNFGTNFTMVMTSQLLGSFLISEVLAGNLYDWEASKQGEGAMCNGAVCYRVTFIVMGGLLMAATAVDVALVLTSRSVYKRIQQQLNFSTP